MAKEQEIEIIIDNDGNVSLEQKGWEGKECQGAIDDLIKSLGKEKSTKKNKDFYKTVEPEVKIRGK